MRDLIRQDAKRKFRISQIESEGNDPVESGQSYGTPHDLASLYGRGRYDNAADVPIGYDEKNPLGRPEEKVTNRNTQDDSLGKDRIGSLGMKRDDEESSSMRTNYKGGSPLALENRTLSAFQSDMLSKVPFGKKQMIFESDKQKESLLDENQIRE